VPIGVGIGAGIKVGVGPTDGVKNDIQIFVRKLGLDFKLDMER
jgi:hypothetical protein